MKQMSSPHFIEEEKKKQPLTFFIDSFQYIVLVQHVRRNKVINVPYERRS